VNDDDADIDDDDPDDELFLSLVKMLLKFVGVVSLWK